MPRPAALIVLWLSAVIFAVACGGGDDDKPTPEPSSPRDAAERWLMLWKDRRYAAMYDLVSPDVQATIDKETFVGRYEAITEESRLSGLDYEVRTPNKNATEVEFLVTFHSEFFGDFPEENTIPLVKDDGSLPSGEAPTEDAGSGSPSATFKQTANRQPSGEWRVQWSPSLFFRGIKGENLVHFFTRIPRRGSILDRTGAPLALDGDLTQIGIVPDQVIDKEATVSGLGGLGIPSDEARAAVNTTLPSYYFIPVQTLAYNTPDDRIQPFRDLIGLGVVVRQSTQRVYPNGDSLAHVLGYMSEVSEEQLKELEDEGFIAGDMLGAAGLEAQYDELLSGVRGALLATITPEGVLDETIAEKPSIPGKDIVLTINAEIQKRAEAELGEKAGTVIVMDPRDNSVLALASFPRFDPNAFIRGLTGEEADRLFNDPKQPFLNRPALAEYPPGSTFKPVTMAAGIERGGFSINSTLPCPPVWTGLGEDYAQNNWQTVDRGYLTPAEGLMASCDPVFYEMGKTLDFMGEDIFPEYIREFGYGSPTGIGIEEADGNVPDATWKEDNIGEAWFTGDAVNMSIGQGFMTATPLQIVNMYSAFAADGVLRKPLLVARIGQVGSSAFQEFQAETIRPLPVSQETLDSIRHGLYLVTQSAGGTSYQAWASSSLDVAGKSGTAEDLSQGSDHVFFAAYANRSAPSIVALGALEEGQSGSAEVAPMLRRIMEAYMAGQLGPTDVAFGVPVQSG